MASVELAAAAVAILAAFYGVWAKHMLDRAKAIDEKARDLLSTHRRLSGRIKLRFAQQLARMTDPEEVMQYVSAIYAKYHSARVTARRLERLIEGRSIAQPARQFTYLGPLVLFLTVVLVVFATDVLMAAIAIGYGVALLALLGYYAEKPLDNYDRMVVRFERILDALLAEEEAFESLEKS